METFGSRLKSERNRLGMSQEAFGAACERGVIMQMKYEKGAGFPDVPYLMKAQDLGVDIVFVLTGQYGGTGLSEDETAVLHGYRQQNMQVKVAALALLGPLPDELEPHNPAMLGDILREQRIINALRRCDQTNQIVIEEFIRQLANANDQPAAD
jgi:transcriptional regulator with XRE-family HTH domain